SFLQRMRSNGTRPKRQPPAKLSTMSEWGQLGVLRQNWKPNSSKVGFKFCSKRSCLEISNGNRLIEGDCTPRVKVDGTELEVSSEIGVSGFVKFDFGEFVELEMEYGQSKLYRQILFLRDDQLIFLNDNFSAPLESRIELENQFPLGESVNVIRESETNEFYLKVKKDYALVVPLSFPEWKIENRMDRGNRFDIGLESRQLSLCQNVFGKGLSLATVFDLKPSRSLKPRTWRQLTIAEKMKTVHRDEAVAYRLQIGKQPWLFYRAISTSGNRTFLGQNFACDFWVGKMDLNGTVSTILEIDT
ncbi:MAG: hypothetical protein AAGA30_19435, partial [Planctomycetota bacterium]